MKAHQYFVYILTDTQNKTLYIGITNHLERRISEHKSRLVSGFAKKYNCIRLVYFEEYKYVTEAIYREKQLKAWRRQWKVELVEDFNPDWKDLSKDWDLCVDPESSSG